MDETDSWMQYLSLNTVDEEYATFTVLRRGYESQALTVTMSRAKWIGMGRPLEISARIQIQPVEITTS